MISYLRFQEKISVQESDRRVIIEMEVKLSRTSDQAESVIDNLIWHKKILADSNFKT